VVLSIGLHSTAHADIVTLAWDASPDPTVLGYRVSYGRSPGNYTSTVNAGSATTYSVPGLADGQPYYFVVEAYSATAVSAPSNEATAVAVGLASVLSDAASPAPSNRPITWTALSGPAALEFRFWRYSTTLGTWTMVQDYSPSNTFTWTPGVDDQGTYTIQVWARLPGAIDDYQALRNAADVTVADAPITIGAIEADAALPASTGTTVTWRARASGGPAPLQYQFWRYSLRTSTWTMVRDYDADDTYAWTPAALDLGAYILEVRVRESGSAATSEQSRDSDVFQIKNAPPAVATVSADQVSPVGAGTPVSWTARAAGGPGPLQYEFLRYRASTRTWAIVQPYGPSNTFSWTPQHSDAGTYSVLAFVRRQGSAALYEALAVSTPMQVSSSSPPVVTGITSSDGTEVGTDIPVTWTVAATGGAGPLQYRFWLYNASRDVFSLLQDYSPSNKVTWTPRTTDTGSYILHVWVKSASSAALLETFAFAPLMTVAPSPPAVQSINANVSTATVGMPIVWTAAISGGQGPVEYLFLRNDTVKRTLTPVQSYSWDNTFGWVPQTGEVGIYRILVCARRAGAPVAADSCMLSAPIAIATN
jgi:hypothetical protein